MLTWTVVAALTVGVFGQRVLGAVLLDTNRLSFRWQEVLKNLPLSIIAAVVALQAVSVEGSLGIDPRLGGIAAAALCAWRRMPIFVAVFAAAMTTALLRWLF